MSTRRTSTSGKRSRAVSSSACAARTCPAPAEAETMRSFTSLVPQRVRRRKARRAPRRQHRRGENEEEPGPEDDENVERLRAERHPRKKVDPGDFGREAHDAKDRQHEAHREAEQNAEDEARAS